MKASCTASSCNLWSGFLPLKNYCQRMKLRSVKSEGKVTGDPEIDKLLASIPSDSEVNQLHACINLRRLISTLPPSSSGHCAKLSAELMRLFVGGASSSVVDQIGSLLLSLLTFQELIAHISKSMDIFISEGRHLHAAAVLSTLSKLLVLSSSNPLLKWPSEAVDVQVEQIVQLVTLGMESKELVIRFEAIRAACKAVIHLQTPGLASQSDEEPPSGNLWSLMRKLPQVFQTAQELLEVSACGSSFDTASVRDILQDIIDVMSHSPTAKAIISRDIPSSLIDTMLPLAAQLGYNIMMLCLEIKDAMQMEQANSISSVGEGVSSGLAGVSDIVSVPAWPGIPDGSSLLAPPRGSRKRRRAEDSDLTMRSGKKHSREIDPIICKAESCSSALPPFSVLSSGDSIPNDISSDCASIQCDLRLNRLTTVLRTLLTNFVPETVNSTTTVKPSKPLISASASPISLSPPEFESSSRGFASRMLQRAGFTGRLGKHGQGIVEPISHGGVRYKAQGLGFVGRPTAGNPYNPFTSKQTYDKALYKNISYDLKRPVTSASATAWTASSVAAESENKIDMSVLSDEQLRIVELVNEGHSLFFTGAAGTGKSFLLRFIIKSCGARVGQNHVFVTASTGIAAANIFGTTLHSFAGVGLGGDSVEVLYHRCKNSKRTFERWTLCKVLIVDEISMIDCYLLDKLDALGKMLKSSDAPFGGIQMIFCGDFYQLPPVMKGCLNAPRFAFEGTSWNATIGNRCFCLRKVFRQKEPGFVNMLNEIRLGLCSETTLKQISELQKAKLTTTSSSISSTPVEEGMSSQGSASAAILPTRLYCKNVDVDSINKKHLQNLPGESYEFVAEATGRQSFCKLMEQRVSPSVELKVGAQVMLLVNQEFDCGLVNGTRGVVTALVTCDSILRMGKRCVMPEVKYTVTDKDGKQHELMRLVEPHEFREESDGEVMAVYTQIPLKLAWALTIHKSQGMSISYLEVSLADAFEYGQVYVALSRATSLAGLRVLGFDQSKIIMNEKLV